MSSGGFDLRGWLYNEDMNAEDMQTVPILGMLWNRRSDTLRLNMERVIEGLSKRVTKRNILSATHQVFDPIGVVCPVLLRPKLLLRKIWPMRIGWDDAPPEEFTTAFLEWLQGLKLLETLRIPRWIGVDSGNRSLHVFCDASKEAFAAVVYLRVEWIEGARLQLLTAKSRLAPTKALTIPRLELLAATIGARLLAAIRETWDPEKSMPVVFWSDSTTVLSWIRRGNDWSVFVSNRVLEIRRLADVKAWRHVPGDMNPADLPSRGCSADQLLGSRWWEGPHWLHHPEERWPPDVQACDEAEVAKELRKAPVVSLAVTASVPWYCRYFSSYRRVVRLIAWIRRYVANCQQPRGKRSAGDLETEELQSAENCLIRLVQSEAFPDKKAVSFGSVYGYLDERGIIVVKTKVAERFDESSFRRPMLLPAKHPLVNLLIRGEHERLCHGGVLLTMNNLREKYWILGGRRAVRSAIAGCVRCKRFSAQRMEVPPVPLPLVRVRDAAVFEIVGVDLAGPLLMRNGRKAWIVLFTCAVYRAVHLELLTSLSSEAFVQSLR
ncbi:hypothetical protein M514_23576 [Trichuris suis]|uniref:Integrase zinc-binding domain-containing protein n=1 Tax=Trichuris suis TaxID=68888 RepID=A0A085N496_9BILA|nr:hypothetical protein M514_23576 [Trichuris suis]